MVEHNASTSKNGISIKTCVKQKKRNCTIIQKCYVSISSYDVKYVWYLRLEATRGKVEFDNFEIIFGSEEKMREKGKVNLKIW